MTKIVSGLALASLLVSAAPAAAANKEHLQLMADIRMLQEQTQLLQNLLGTLNESLKAVNARLDEQANATRKAFADQKLIVDQLSGDTRVVREKLDDNNVRIGSLSQEIDALRQALQQLASRATAATTPEADAAASTTGSPPGGVPPAGGTAPTPSPVVPLSPKKMEDSAMADYGAGLWDLAIDGFEAYIRQFPKSDFADNAQVYICNSYLQQNKNEQAVEACDRAIRNYPGGDAVPQAYWYKGLAQNNLKDTTAARATWEELMTKFPDSSAALMAKQRLEQLKRP